MPREIVDILGHLVFIDNNHVTVYVFPAVPDSRVCIILQPGQVSPVADLCVPSFIAWLIEADNFDVCFGEVGI